MTNICWVETINSLWENNWSIRQRNTNMKYTAINSPFPFSKFTICREIFVRMIYVFNLIQIGNRRGSQMLSIVYILESHKLALILHAFLYDEGWSNVPLGGIYCMLSWNMHQSHSQSFPQVSRPACWKVSEVPLCAQNSLHFGPFLCRFWCN